MNKTNIQKTERYFVQALQPSPKTHSAPKW